MAKEAYYFSHDSNARTDTKIMAMILDHKASGYGLYWAIVEMLSEQDGYRLRKNKITFNAIAMAMLCEANAVEKFVIDCINDYELFKADDTYFWSESLIRRMSLKEEKRIKRSAAGKKGAEIRWNNSNDIANAWQSDSNAMQDDSNDIAKDSKGKERKGKEIKIINIPYQEIYDLYLEQNIIKHKSLTDKMKDAIKKASKKYSLEDIKTAIQRYGTMRHDATNEYASKYCQYDWTLEELLTRDKGIADFLDEGGKWIRYRKAGESERANAAAYSYIE